MLPNFFGGEAIYALISGGVFMGIATLLMIFVDDKADEEMDAAADTGT